MSYSVGPRNRAFHDPSVPFQQTSSSRSSFDYSANSIHTEGDNDDYIHQILTGVRYKCCGCDKNEDDMQKLRYASDNTSRQKDLSALTCDNCAKAPCSNCTYSVSDPRTVITTPGRILVPYEPLDRRIYIFLCDSCGKAKEIPSLQDKAPTTRTVPLPRGRQLSFSRNGAVKDTKFYANLDRAKCNDCNHRVCKDCVFFDAPNRWGGGKGGMQARRGSRASSIVKAIANATITASKGETGRRNNSRASRISTPEPDERRGSHENNGSARPRYTTPNPSQSACLEQLPQPPTPARLRHPNRQESHNLETVRVTSRQPSPGMISYHKSMSDYQYGGPDLDIGAALHRRDTDEEETRGREAQQSTRQHRTRAPAPKIVPLNARGEEWDTFSSPKAPISPVDPDWKDDGIERKVSRLFKDPEKQQQSP